MKDLFERFFFEADQRIPNDRKILIDHDDIPFLREEHGELYRGIDKDFFFNQATLYRFQLKDIESLESSLSSNEQELIDGAIRHIGFEVLAFYKSRRFLNLSPFEGAWGIFYIDKGISRIFELMKAACPHNNHVSLKTAYTFLKRHEYFHYKFDLYAMAIEANLQQSLYIPLKEAFRHNKCLQREEAIANQEAWKWSKTSSINLENFAFDFMKIQPGAYSLFDEDEFDLKSKLAGQLLKSGFGRDDQALWIGTIPKQLSNSCPQYLINVLSLDKFIDPAYGLRIKHINESKQFTKLINKRYRGFKKRWIDTKRKLLSDPNMQGLRFKPWKDGKHWTVRVNDNLRAHLQPKDMQKGIWEAQEIGTHKAMGHG